MSFFFALSLGKYCSDLFLIHLFSHGKRTILRRLKNACPFKVDKYVSRDLDSRITAREAAAVTEWLDPKYSTSPLHAMRDSPRQGVPYLGAAWGSDMTRGDARQAWKRSWSKILEDMRAWSPRGIWGPDQVVLVE